MTYRDTGWCRAVLKAAEAIWARHHGTDREPRLFGDLDIDTLDDYCIQAQDAVDAYLDQPHCACRQCER